MNGNAINPKCNATVSNIVNPQGSILQFDSFYRQIEVTIVKYNTIVSAIPS